jgi:hypothetical protein
VEGVEKDKREEKEEKTPFPPFPYLRLGSPIHLSFFWSAQRARNIININPGLITKENIISSHSFLTLRKYFFKRAIIFMTCLLMLIMVY